MNSSWIIPFIIIGGALQTCGAAMNGQLNKHMVNPWLASATWFALMTFFFVGAFLIIPHPLPTTQDVASMPRWAIMGGLVGAVQVYAGLTLVNRVGAGRSWILPSHQSSLCRRWSITSVGFVWTRTQSTRGERLVACF
jgi:transporter family-2 protein